MIRDFVNFLHFKFWMKVSKFLAWMIPEKEKQDVFKFLLRLGSEKKMKEDKMREAFTDKLVTAKIATLTCKNRFKIVLTNKEKRILRFNLRSKKYEPLQDFFDEDFLGIDLRVR